jgi:hypothetical protein
MKADRGRRKEENVKRFKPYPAYKDSGVEWLGEIPAHWKNGKLRLFWSAERINVAQIKNFTVTRLPYDEQLAIAAFLDGKTANIDALVVKIREAVERLKEYRTALISAAVTGKIDVRDEGKVQAWIESPGASLTHREDHRRASRRAGAARLESGRAFI